MKNKLDITQLSLCSLLVAFLCASSYIVIPLPFAGAVFSLHTVAVNLIALLLKPRNAAVTIGVYLLMGLIGLPVFASGTSGVGKLFGVTGGFYFGFLISAVLMSRFKGDSLSFKRYLAVTMAIGLPVQHLCAVIFMGFHNGFDLGAAFVSISLPFIFTDALKCFILLLRQ